MIILRDINLWQHPQQRIEAFIFFMQNSSLDIIYKLFIEWDNTM